MHNNRDEAAGEDRSETLQVAAERQMTVGGLLQTLKLPRLETSGFISVTTSRRDSCPEFQIRTVESFQMNPWITCSRIRLQLAAPAGETATTTPGGVFKVRFQTTAGGYVSTSEHGEGLVRMSRQQLLNAVYLPLS